MSIYQADELTVSRTLHQARLERRESLREVAQEIGVSASTISRIERGRAMDAPLGTIVSLCDHYNLTLDELLLADVDDLVAVNDLREDIETLRDGVIELAEILVAADRAQSEGKLETVLPHNTMATLIDQLRTI